jgi:hypothetical protein
MLATIHATPNPVQHGQVVVLHGRVSGCEGERLTLLSEAFKHGNEFAGVPAVIVRVRADAHYRKGTRIPAGRAPGKYQITGRCGGGNIGALEKLKVK